MNKLSETLTHSEKIGDKKRKKKKTRPKEKYRKNKIKTATLPKTFYFILLAEFLFFGTFFSFFVLSNFSYPRVLYTSLIEKKRRKETKN